jgi:peptidoglycan hydrolase-like protein with peptidoglycan-binding domain
MMKGVEFSRMMKKGSRGEDVRRLQLALNVLGYDAGTADGVFGTKTQNAVKAFQRAEGLETDGIAGPKTLEILAARTAEPDVPELPDEDVDESQTMLVNLMELMAARDLVARALNKIDEMLKNGGMVS